MIQKKDKCSDCGGFYFISNKKFMLCFRCNSKRLYYEKKKVKPLPNLNDLYTQIWKERPHFCEVTGENLFFQEESDLWRSCFAHLFPKGKFPKWRSDKNNILLMHPSIHHLYDNSTKEKLIEKIGADGMKIILAQMRKVLKQ